jgi:PRTRC genetic system ThiF family protein
MQNDKIKERMHFVAPYLQNPVHPVTVTLVGAGGNGSQMLSALARINTALKTMDHPGLNVTVWDDDTVEEANIGRQLFSWNDIGMNKAVCLVTRFNRFYGTAWNAVPKKFGNDSPVGNIIITCVDNISTRFDYGRRFKKKTVMNNEYSTFYWLDLGNGQRHGQAVLGSADIKQPKTSKYETVSVLPLATEELTFNSRADKDSGPSCSLAEALKKQDLFVNSSLTQLAGSILWTLFTAMAIDIRGFYMNLDTMRTSPIKV